MVLPVPADEVRALAFVTLVGANIALIFVNRTFSSSLRAALGRPNRLLAWGLGITIALIAMILSWPDAASFLRPGAVARERPVAVPGASAGLLVVLEFSKSAWRRRLR